MRRFRFSIGGLMGLVLYAALAFGALRVGDDAWATGLVTAFLVLLAASLVALAVGRAERRPFWAGFVAFAGIYALAAFSPRDPAVRPALPTHWLLTKAFERSGRPATVPNPLLTGTMPTFNFITTATGPAPRTAGLVLSPMPGGSTAVTGGSTALSFTVALSMAPPESYYQCGHALLAPLVGLAGGLVAGWVVRRRDRRDREKAMLVEPEPTPA